MKKQLGLLLVLLCLVCFLFTKQTSSIEGDNPSHYFTDEILTLLLNEGLFSQVVIPDENIQKSIRKVDSFVNYPVNYSYFDYRRQAIELDKVLFSFANDPIARQVSFNPYDVSSWNPIGYWIDQPRQPSTYNPLVTGYLKRTFGLPTYLGDNRVVSSGSEPMTTLATILGSSYAGIDKSQQRYHNQDINFVEMVLASYDTGSQLVHNVGTQGQSFWYDIFPQILFARIYDLYPDTVYMREMVINGAQQWLESLPYFVKNGQVDYEFVGYNVVLESPTTVGRHIEPPNGGLAFLFYSAYEITKEQRFLDGAVEVLNYFQDYQKNPNYEALTDYAPYVAAVLNAKYGYSYDVGKFLDFIFEEDSAFRPGWSVMSGSFGGLYVDGLVGQRDDYAFSMNSFHLASVLGPMVKYDTRYASAIGKYLLALVNNAKVFFPQLMPLHRQSMNQYLSFDLKGSMVYEGFRRNFASVDGYAMGDATSMFGQPSDLSIYSSAFIGFLGGMVQETNVKGILQIDLNKTDSFGRNAFAHYLYYNPLNQDQMIQYQGPSEAYDLFDLVNNQIIARNVKNQVNIHVPANGSRIVVQLPAKSTFTVVNNQILANGIVMKNLDIAVNLPSLFQRQELTSSTDIMIQTRSGKWDSIVSMEIYFNDILAYSGEPISQFRYNKAILPNTDYTLKVIVYSQNGKTDVASKRVVAR
ncbi:MAG: hypothetical protein Q8M70_05690 [bacterium]|nr:hypothetical protein [bacterium]